MTESKDWRKDYVVCEHVAKDKDLRNLAHEGFRVCCQPCFEKGFIVAELEWTVQGALRIAKIRGKVDSQPKTRIHAKIEVEAEAEGENAAQALNAIRRLEKKLLTTICISGPDHPNRSRVRKTTLQEMTPEIVEKDSTPGEKP
jgi:hypothetical protein